MMPTVARDNRKRRAVQRTDNRYHSTPEWYTPPWLVDRIETFLGPDYLDPCPASHGRPQENGLAMAWHGRVYLNPPYGKDIAPWIRKAVCEPAVSEIVLLVPAYTDARWFAPLFSSSALCFVRGRVRFVRADGCNDPAPHPSVLVYRGRRWRKFAEAFAPVGPIVRLVRAYEPAQPQLLTEHTA